MRLGDAERDDLDALAGEADGRECVDHVALAGDLRGVGLDRKVFGLAGGERRRERATAVADDDVEVGEPAHLGGVCRGVHDGEVKHAEWRRLRLEVQRRGRDRPLVAGLQRDLAIAHEDDAGDAARVQELFGSSERAGGVAGEQRRAQHLVVVRDRRHQLECAVVMGVEEPDGDVVPGADVGLPHRALALAQEAEQQHRDGHHRHDHDQDEEQPQPIAKAHVWGAYRRLRDPPIALRGPRRGYAVASSGL